MQRRFTVTTAVVSVAVEGLSGFSVCTDLPFWPSNSLQESSWSPELQLILVILQLSYPDGDGMEVYLKHPSLSEYHNFCLLNIVLLGWALASTASQRSHGKARREHTLY